MHMGIDRDMHDHTCTTAEHTRSMDLYIESWRWFKDVVFFACLALVTELMIYVWQKNWYEFYVGVLEIMCVDVLCLQDSILSWAGVVTTSLFDILAISYWLNRC